MIYSIYKHKTFLYVLVFALVFCTVFITVQNFSRVAYADNASLNFDNTNVLDDLESSTVNGKPFDFLEYAFDESKMLQIINVVEYCYSYKSNMRGNYGIYIYVYNPQGIDIVERSGQNKIQMAVSWVKNSDGIYSANRYEKFNLQFCNKSEKSNYKGLFYKFKVVDKTIDGKTMADRVNSMERRYDVSGIELLTKGNTNATEYGVGCSYRFSGYAQGYGDSDENTLSCVCENLETLSLEVHHTYYRTNVSSLGKGHYNEVNTVYFSVPDRIFKTYGNLQKIHAEWWEYKTKMALVLSDQSFVDLALNYSGKEVANYNTDGDYLTRLYDQNIPFGAYSNFQMNTDDAKALYSWTFNIDLEDGWKAGAVGKEWKKYCDNISTILPLVFYSPASDIDSVFSFLYSKQVAGNVESSVVADYIYNYSNDLGNGYVDCNGRKISKDLFEDYVDVGRTMGYNNQTIDLQDTFNLMSYDSNHSWWNKLCDYGFSWPPTDGDYLNVAPIYELTDNDLLKDDNTFANDLLVNKDDINFLRTYYAQEKLKGNHVILFRFANTDYYSNNALMIKKSGSGSANGYIAQMTCFFDFDIIDLTFNKEGVYTVIPAVSSPVDIINGFNPPPSGVDWWKLVLMVIALILFAVLLAPVLPYVLKALIWVVALPFKAIGKIIKKFESYHHVRNDKTNGVKQSDLDNKSKTDKRLNK